jgi:methionyl-tRNA formyltransferase
MRIAFAGNRDLSVQCLEFLMASGVRPEVILAPNGHDSRLVMASGLPPERVLVGQEFKEPGGIELLASLDLDYLIGVHFPYIVPEAVLSLPRIGAVNLHPGLLPYNRGWHTPSWAILEGSPIGVTLHFMDASVDTGDIVAQSAMEIRPEDTADSLYRRLLALEFDVFREAWPLLASGNPPRRRQPQGEGSSHTSAELRSDRVRRLDLNASSTVGDTLRTLRALTTNDVTEAAYFEEDGRRYLVQIEIIPQSESDPGAS